MLSLATSNRVTFNVNVSGTAAQPTVRCVVGDHPAYSFPASKISDGSYEVLIDLPKEIKTDKYPFKVEVLLNGRLFTPINTTIEVAGEKQEEPKVAKTTAKAKKTEPAAEPVVLTQTEPMPFREADPEAKPVGLSGLEKLAKTPVFAKPAPAVEIKRIRISMADVANEAEKIEKPAAAPKAQKKPTPKPAVVEARPVGIPVSLTKGDIIYR